MAALVPDKNNQPETDYILKDEMCWITVGPFSVHVRDLGDAVSVDIFPRGEENDDPVSSSYVGFPVPEDAAVEEFNAVMEDIEAVNGADVDVMLGWAR